MLESVGYVRGEHVSPGYYKMPDATRENYTDDGFLKTGDALYYNEKGLLYIVDRYKEVTRSILIRSVQ